MKKTIIALLALSGLAVADVQDFTSLAFGDGVYATGYSFQFVIDADYDLATDGSIVAYYGGSHYQSTYGSNVFKLIETNDVLTLSAGVGTMNGGLAADSDIQASTGVNYLRSVTFSTTLQTGTVYTVTGSNGGDQSIDITLSWAGGSETKEDFNGNMNGYNSSIWARVNSANVVVAPAVPEPTTATLSLLALAGLAARRRRK